MKLSDLGEFGLIERIRKLSQGRSAATLVGIGDDAAAFRPAPSSALLATTDLLLEGVHFDLSYTDYYSLGWKSAAVNLSDIAAMGGTPRFCLTALGIPPSVSPGQVLDFYRGVNDLLRRYDTALVGGDTCSSRRELFISITAMGEAKRSRIITRSGARAGDRIFVTHSLGDAAAGLDLLRQGVREPAERTGRSAVPGISAAEAKVLEKHLRPVPRVKEGMVLSRSGCPSAMIDVSDGLSSDLFHICRQSGVGADISAEAIPRSKAFTVVAGRLSRPWPSQALSGGEDYELLFTVPPRRLAKLASLKLALTEIGVITRRPSILIADAKGKQSPCIPQGYDHFAGTAAKRGRR